MILLVECVAFSILFSLMIFIPLYKNPKHHIFGAIIGTAIGIIVAGLSAIYFEVYGIMFM